MSIIAPYPQSGVAPKYEALDYDMLKPAPYVPRKTIDALAYERLVDLSADLMAPAGEIIARPFENHYEILFGDEYLRAYQEAVPRGKVLVSLYHYTDSEAVRIAIDLNQIHFNLSVMDVAESYSCVLKHFQWRNAELARALDLKPSTICNRLKLIGLNHEIKMMVSSGQLSLEQAKALSRLSPSEQLHFGKLAVQHDWNTRQLYKKIHPEWNSKDQADQGGVPPIVKDSELLRLEQNLGDATACPVKLDTDKKKRYAGKLRAPFFSISELAGLIERIERSSENELRWKGEVHFEIDGLDHLNDILGDLLPTEEMEC